MEGSCSPSKGHHRLGASAGAGAGAGGATAAVGMDSWRHGIRCQNCSRLNVGLSWNCVWIINKSAKIPGRSATTLERPEPIPTSHRCGSHLVLCVRRSTVAGFSNLCLGSGRPRETVPGASCAPRINSEPFITVLPGRCPARIRIAPDPHAMIISSARNLPGAPVPVVTPARKNLILSLRFPITLQNGRLAQGTTHEFDRERPQRLASSQSPLHFFRSCAHSKRQNLTGPDTPTNRLPSIARRSPPVSPRLRQGGLSDPPLCLLDLL